MTLTSEQLFAYLRMDPDPCMVLVPLIKRIDYERALKEWKPDAAWDAARDAARAAAYNAAYNAAYDAARAAAYNAARDAAWTAARAAAWDAARDAALDAAYTAAYTATLLAGCMVVHDLIEQKHLDFALQQMCWWLQFI